MFGGHRAWRIILWIVAFWLAGNLCASAIYDAAQGRFHPAELTGLFLPLLVVWFGVQIRRASNRIVPAFMVNQQPMPAKALVLFLSPPTDLGAIARIAGDLRVEKTAKDFETDRWHMPMSAIAHHLKILERVVVIASPDAPGKPGTRNHFDAFRDTVKRLTPSDPNLVVTTYGDGVDFEDAAALIAALETVFRELHAEGYRDEDIVVDVTGGQKVPTVAGAVFTMTPERRFHYVSTHDYRVLSFDLGYREDYAATRGN